MILYCRGRRGCHSRMITAISLITTSLHSIWVPETDYLIFLSFPVQSHTALSKSSLTHFVFKSGSTPLNTPLGGRISITRDQGRIYLNGPPHSKEAPKLLFWVDSLLYHGGTSPGRIRLNKVLYHFNTNVHVRLVLFQGFYIATNRNIWIKFHCFAKKFNQLINKKSHENPVMNHCFRSWHFQAVTTMLSAVFVWKRLKQLKHRKWPPF